jgi:hypothetical protein
VLTSALGAHKITNISSGQFRYGPPPNDSSKMPL